MTWMTAAMTGAGLGLVSFFGLWLTVRHLPRGPWAGAWVALSSLGRLALIGVVFYGLARHGAAVALAGLGGLWLARWCLVRQLGGERHGG